MEKIEKRKTHVNYQVLISEKKKKTSIEIPDVPDCLFPY